MIDEGAIWRTAMRQIERYGEEAARRAVLRATELVELGDTLGSAIWQQILNAIQELQRGRRAGERLN